MAAELLIQNGNKVFIPVVQEDIQWTTERKGNPGKLFTWMIPLTSQKEMQSD